MDVTIPISQTPSPTFQVRMTTYFCVALRSGRLKVFEEIGFNYRSRTASYEVSSLGNLSSGAIYQFIDPISAVWMGLVTVEELGLSEQTLAVLKLAMQDVIP